MKNYILEGCVDSVESAVAASAGGANRLELCANLIIGGTTPSLALFREVRKNSSARIHVLIRPRFGDFCYTDYEFAIMKEEVKMFRELGADGVVIGILKPDGSLDGARMAALIDLAGPMSITLHRAFDQCANPIETLEQAIALKINTILTSGQKANCVEGKTLIKKLISEAKGEIDILVGGGVCAAVINELYKDTKATSYHMSGKIVKDSPMIYRSNNVNMGLPSLSEYEIWQTDEKNLKEAKKVLEEISQI